MMLLLFGTVQLARVFYVYHALQKAVRGGTAMLVRSVNVDYCNPGGDLTIQDAKNFIVYGNLQGLGQPVVPGLTADLIQVFAERSGTGSTVQACTCSEDDTDPASCRSTVGQRPDFVVINFGSGFPLSILFSFVNLSSVNLRVSVRMPVIGG